MSKNSNLLLLGAGAVAAYLLYSKAKVAAAAVGKAYDGSVLTFSDWLSSAFGPKVTLPGVFYTVVFEDGTSHAVPANTVDAQGNFVWTGYPAGSQPATPLQILVGTDGAKYAISSAG